MPVCGILTGYPHSHKKDLLMHVTPTPSRLPTSKVTAMAAAGAAATLIVWIAQLFGADVPAEVSAAFTTLLTFAAGWFKTENRPV